MADYARIEPETEVHRTEKALRSLAPSAQLPFERAVVHVKVQTSVHETPVAQHVTFLLVHLLLRMKGVVEQVWIEGMEEATTQPGVPLEGPQFFEGLRNLAATLNGPRSPYVTSVHKGTPETADVVVAVGDEHGDIRLGADAWRALVGAFVAESRWGQRCPLGAAMAATIGAAEVSKRLVAINVGVDEGLMVGDLAFSLLDYNADEDASAGPDIGSLVLEDVAIAGAGAGGTAVLHTLASFPSLDGRVVLVEPGALKVSNLNRYLMSTDADVHSARSKLDSARAFLGRHAPNLEVETVPKEWEEASGHEWGLVVSTVDTPEARWQVQRTSPRIILDGGVMMGTLYAVLRVVPAGWCLECKHPPDADITWKKRAAMWGIGVQEAKTRHFERKKVTEADVVRLAEVQGRAAGDFSELVGLPFDEIPAKTECGTTPLSLKVPSQAPVLPFATTAAGIVIAAEIVKEVSGVGTRLHNYLTHDLRYRPKVTSLRFKPQRAGCQSVAHSGAS